MSDVSRASAARQRTLLVVEIIIFFGVLELLHLLIPVIFATRFSWLPDTWYPVCVRSVDLVALLGMFVVLRKWRGRTDGYPSGLAVKGAIPALIVGTVFGAVLQSVHDLALLPHSFWQRTDVRVGLHEQWAHFPWLAVLLFFVMGALREEAIWRGYVLEALERRWGSGWALAVSAIGFGLWHLDSGRTIFEAAEIALNGGVLLGAVYLGSRDLWLPIGLHLGMNTVSSFLKGCVAYPDAALPPVTFEAHGIWAAAQLLVFQHIELLAAGVVLLFVVKSGRWRPRPHPIEHE